MFSPVATWCHDRRRLVLGVWIVLLFVGFAGSKGFVTESDVALREGERATVAGYTFVNEGSSTTEDAHSRVVTVTMGVFRGDERVAEWHRTARQWTTRWREELMTPAPGTPCGPQEWELDDSRL